MTDNTGDRFALFSRLLQFRAGPNEHTFYACAAHRDELNRVELFFATEDEPIRPVDQADEIDCYFCQEG